MGLDDSRTKEFTAGLGAAVVSITLIYPVTKCIYRQILENAKFEDSINKMRKEGFRYLYRGVGPPMIQRCTELSMMFGVYRSAEVALKPLRLCHYQERLASSAIAGIVEAVFTPLERIQMLLIDSRYNHRFRNMGQAALVIGSHYGFKEFYRGLSVIVWRNVGQNMFFFTTKEKLYDIMDRQKSLQKSVKNFTIGSIIGLTMTTIFYPIKVTKVHLQQQLGGEFQSMLKAVKVVYARDNRGIRNFYRGLTLNIVRSCFSWGVTNLSYEFIRMNI